MRDFLFQPLQPDGKPTEPLLASFETEGDAIAFALSRTFPGGCEVWQGFRLLGRFCGPGRIPAATDPAGRPDTAALGHAPPPAAQSAEGRPTIAS